MPEKHLVTGVSGFLGSRTVDELLSRGHTVVGVDTVAPKIGQQGLDFHLSDIRDEERMYSLLHNVDVVHHQAALVPIAGRGREFWSVNVQGSASVAKAANRAGVGKFIYTSSSAVYGKTYDSPITQETARKPMEPYGKSKLVGEQVCARALEATDSELVVVRPRTIVGGARGGIFSLFFDWMRRGEPIFTLGKGDNKFQFVHIDDFLSAYFVVLESGQPGAFNVGSERFWTLRETFERLIALVGSSSPIIALPKLPAIVCLSVLETFGLSPIRPYHRKAFHRSFYFDMKPMNDLGWSSKFSSVDALYDSYLNQTGPSKSLGLENSPNSSELRAKHLTWIAKKIYEFGQHDKK